jgi:hypothetical protein
VERRLSAADPIVHALSRTRATLEFGGKRRTNLVLTDRKRFSLAAPLFADRALVAIVVYGRNVSRLNLDADERERLTRLVAHASLALASIELAQTRAQAPLVPDALIAVEPHAPERVGD